MSNMSKKITILLKRISLILLLIFQINFSFSANLPVQHFNLESPDLNALIKEDIERDKAGILYRVGVATNFQLNTASHGTWTTLANRNRKWQISISQKGAESLSFVFKKFVLYGNASFWVENKKGEKISKIFTNEDMLEDWQQIISMCEGDEAILTLVEDEYGTSSEIELERVFYNYRSTVRSKEKINESASCEVNINCSEGDEYQDEKRGVARIYVVEGNTAGFCSGSLINNKAKDCKPLFLTALHCGINTSSNDMKLWQFFFNYESPSCSNPSTTGTLASNYITGCVRLADANDNGGDSGSDFLLVQLGTLATESTTIELLKSTKFNAYWNGWDANNTASSKGVGIHHPSGDIKKISTYNSAVYSDTYGGIKNNTHWVVTWVSTSNGYGITEGGSSGSPLFTYNNGNSRIVGSLTGGSSYCNTPTYPDYYGKLSYHWSRNGTSTDQRLATYIDPANSGEKTMDGSSNPCSLAAIREITLEEKINVYPNPSNEIIFIESSNITNYSIQVIDVVGTIVQDVKMENGKATISLSNLAGGIYHVKISKEGKSVTKSIVKI